MLKVIIENGELLHDECGGRLNATVENILFRCPVSLGDAWDLGNVHIDIDQWGPKDQQSTLVYLRCGECDAYSKEVEIVGGDPLCSECSAWEDVESTYCGSFCEEHLAEHLEECEPCARDWHREG
jgi:hypothetical protein